MSRSQSVSITTFLTFIPMAFPTILHNLRCRGHRNQVKTNISKQSPRISEVYSTPVVPVFIFETKPSKFGFIMFHPQKLKKKEEKATAKPNGFDQSAPCFSQPHCCKAHRTGRGPSCTLAATKDRWGSRWGAAKSQRLETDQRKRTS